MPLFHLDDQLIINIQLERSQLARELSQIFHELNYFNHTSLSINNTIPFHFTLPTVHQPQSCMQFYTSEHTINERNMEQYYSLLLFKPVSFYLRAAKADLSSFYARFLELASPFITFESMSVILDVPLQKIYACALSLQAANTAVIHMCITKYTHFAVVSFSFIDSSLPLIFPIQPSSLQLMCLRLDSRNWDLSSTSSLFSAIFLHWNVCSHSSVSPLHLISFARQNLH